jgi:DNA helicase-2/ATP-dependent DNA helicase PcrA
LTQLRSLATELPYQILPSKAVALRQIANTLPKPYKFRPAIDLAAEIEWAKNRRISADDYAAGLQGHEPPIPVDLMASVYKRYEKGKQERSLIDFEDLLELTIRMFQEDEWASERFAGRYHSFTVDEYQDVNLLQETLLREWLYERDDLCVVGDDYQSIYGFTGATPEYLLSMPSRFQGTLVVRLESNYRSTPQVLDVANRLVPNLGGAEKVLTATRDDGTEPALRMFSNPDGEMTFILSRIRSLFTDGVPYEEMAILYRVNFRSEDYEEALAGAGIPYQVRDGAFLNRATARHMLGTLARSKSTAVVSEVGKVAARQGYLEEVPDGVGDQELTRQNDLARFIRMAEEFDDGVRTCADFVQDLQDRFGGGQGRGVNLATYHRAKGLEFEAVFLPRLEDGELPFKRSKSPEAIVEERRLFYVGITRAKSHLAITWVNDGRRKASAFVGELREGKVATGLPRVPEVREEIAAAVGMEMEAPGGFAGVVIEIVDGGVTLELDGGAALYVPYGERVTAADKTLPLGPPNEDAADAALIEELKAWRLKRARADEVPAYVVFHDATLQDIATSAAASVEELAEVKGVGPAKLERYGDEIISLLTRAGSRTSP